MQKAMKSFGKGGLMRMMRGLGGGPGGRMPGMF
jgi:hypothetical protein